MNASTQPHDPVLLDATAAADDPRMVQAMDEYLAALGAGRRPERQAFLAAHADIAEKLAGCLDGLEFIEGACPQLQEGPRLPGEDAGTAVSQGTLGDYRLTQEIGRGGMGIVYEAEQISLSRRVALKVLPFASTLEPRHLQRFKNEAHAAAHLQHPNIVPVFATGCERGVHYYVMQLVEGQTLAELIRQLRQSQGRAMQGQAPEATTDHGVAAHVSTVTAPATAGATARSRQTPAYFRSVVHIGLQAAEALEYAHQMGIVHRDIKPGNLLIEQAPAAVQASALRLWITDFGLAHCQNQVGPTMTGDMIGTLRYMSPEQTMAKRFVQDHRTDVYSLGATLYELLTLEPAFPGEDPQELMRQIAGEEPRPPRQHHRDIPAELETIVLKAMEKNPADRFGTAQEMADDLRRYLNDEPIRARRPSIWHRARKWSQRHKALVRSAAIASLVSLTILAGSIGWVISERAALDTALDKQVEAVLDEAASQIEDANWPGALAAVERADKLLVSAGRSQRPPRLAELQRDVDMARRLEDVYSQPRNNDLDYSKEQDAEYVKAFRDYGIDVTVLSTDEAAGRIRARSIRRELALALDFWSLVRQRAAGKEAPDWKQLLGIAQAADPDPFRNRLREVRSGGDRKALVALAVSADVRLMPPETLALLGGALTTGPKDGPNYPSYVLRGKADDAPTQEQIGTFLRDAQRQYPGDVWITSTLAQYCRGRMQFDDAVRFYTAAVVLRPHNPHFVYGLGDALLFKGSPREAVVELSRAIEWNPNHVDAVLDRATAYVKLRQADKVLEDYSRAIELGYESPHAWYWRGWAYTQLRQWDKALAEFAESRKKAASANVFQRYRIGASGVPSDLRYFNAYCCSVVGQWAEAAADLKTARLGSAALRSTPPDDTWLQLACLQLLQGDIVGYRQLCQQLLERQPKEGFSGLAGYITGRTCALLPEGSAPAAKSVLIAEKALASDPKAPWLLHTLALAHYRAGQFEAAVRWCRESEKADPNWRGTMVNQMLLAIAYQRLDRREEARQCMATAASWRKEVLDGTYKGQAGAPPDMHLSDWLAFEVLHREAQGMFSR